jgi:hypothetical protein
MIGDHTFRGNRLRTGPVRCFRRTDPVSMTDAPRVRTAGRQIGSVGTVTSGPADDRTFVVAKGDRRVQS